MTSNGFYVATIGDEVRYHSVSCGWLFGTVLAIRNGETEEGGVQIATVRWHGRGANGQMTQDIASCRMEQVDKVPAGWASV